MPVERKRFTVIDDSGNEVRYLPVFNKTQVPSGVKFYDSEDATEALSVTSMDDLQKYAGVPQSGQNDVHFIDLYYENPQNVPITTFRLGEYKKDTS